MLNTQVRCFFHRSSVASRAISRSAAVLLLILLAAHVASAQKVTTEFDRNADFGKYKTFAIRMGRLNSNNPALNSDLVKQRIEGDIEKFLTGMGLTEVTGNAKSDLNIRYTAERFEFEYGFAGALSPALRGQVAPRAVANRICV